MNFDPEQLKRIAADIDREYGWECVHNVVRKPFVADGTSYEVIISHSIGRRKLSGKIMFHSQFIVKDVFDIYVIIELKDSIELGDILDYGGRSETKDAEHILMLMLLQI